MTKHGMLIYGEALDIQAKVCCQIGKCFQGHGVEHDLKAIRTRGDRGKNRRSLECSILIKRLWKC